jgi:hypothetical protein
VDAALSFIDKKIHQKIDGGHRKRQPPHNMVLFCQPRVETLVQLLILISPELKIVLHSIVQIGRGCWHMLGHLQGWLIVVRTNLRT